MKNILKLSVAICALLITMKAIYGGAFGAEDTDPIALAAKMDDGATNKQFELVNASGKPIYVGILNGHTSYKVTKIEPRAFFDFSGKNKEQEKINIKNATYVAIWSKDPGIDASIKKKYWIFGSVVTSPKADALYTFAPGKKLILKYNANGTLTSQQPPLKGAVRSASGLAIEGNVTSDVIALPVQ